MVIRWKLKYSRGFDQLNYQQLSKGIVPLLGLTQEETTVTDSSLDIRPNSLQLSEFITPIRLSVYDILLVNDKETKTLVFQFRLYKLLVFPLIFFITLIIPTVPIFHGLIVGLLAYFGSILLFGLFTLWELRWRKKNLERFLANAKGN